MKFSYEQVELFEKIKNEQNEERLLDYMSLLDKIGLFDNYLVYVGLWESVIGYERSMPEDERQIEDICYTEQLENEIKALNEKLEVSENLVSGYEASYDAIITRCDKIINAYSAMKDLYDGMTDFIIKESSAVNCEQALEQAKKDFSLFLSDLEWIKNGNRK